MALKWVAIGGRVVTVLGDIHSMRKKQRARLKALRSVNDKSEYIHEHHMNIKVYIVTIPIGPRGSPQEFSGLQSTGNVMRCHEMSCHVMSCPIISRHHSHLGTLGVFPVPFIRHKGVQNESLYLHLFTLCFPTSLIRRVSWSVVSSLAFFFSLGNQGAASATKIPMPLYSDIAGIK